MGKNNGNRYSEEFKQGAVKLVLENKQNIAEACRNLGVSRGTMERWLAAETDSHDIEKIRMQQLEDEVRRLRKEKADLEDTVEILKKAAVPRFAWCPHPGWRFASPSVKAREKAQNNPQT